MAEKTKEVMQAERIPFLQKRHENRLKRTGDVAGTFSQKVEDDCNRELRILNCKIQGIPIPEADLPKKSAKTTTKKVVEEPLG